MTAPDSLIAQIREYVRVHGPCTSDDIVNAVGGPITTINFSRRVHVREMIDKAGLTYCTMLMGIDDEGHEAPTWVCATQNTKPL
jgi:hypothetical protein